MDEDLAHGVSRSGRGVAGQDSGYEPLDFASDPPPRWRHPVTGRYDWQPPPALVRFGRYLLRSRYFAKKSQETVSAESGVSQSMISRAERALAPAMGVDKLVDLGGALGSNLPLGFCPHDHVCQWQPLSAPAGGRDLASALEPDPSIRNLVEAGKRLWLPDSDDSGR